MRLAPLALLLLTACAPAAPLCFLSGEDGSGAERPARTVLTRTAVSGSGCVLIATDTHYVLPEGEATAATLTPEGDRARLTLTAVAFGADGAQERITLSGLAPLPLALPATLERPTAVLRRAEPGGAPEESGLLVESLTLEAAGDGRVAGRAAFVDGQEGSATFDAPARIALP